MLTGYTGKILHVDLSQGKIWVETPGESFYRTYIGGSAMGLVYILKDVPAGIDGLDPANVLTWMLSAPTGAPISGQSRMCVNARSPLVDGIGDSQCGGFFPAELKFAGFDGIVFTGKAPIYQYLWIHDGEAELRDASALWGKTTSQAEAHIKQELGDPKIEVAQCGPAAEKGTRLAAIINMGNRANGRTGMGAVMASKNLRAVAVRGKTRRVPLANAQRLGQLARWGAGDIENNGDVLGLREYGTPSVVGFQNTIGSLPTLNYTQGQFPLADHISGETMKDTVLKENDTCFACAVRCKRVVETEWQGRPVEGQHGGPEYETLGTFGSYCGVDDLQAICLANKICNENGLDTIGTGATIAWAMECFQNGLITADDIGYPLHFGDSAAMIRLLEQMVAREGFGEVLADGSRRAAERLGKGHAHLITVKGAEAPAHMPQAKRSLGLIYAVNPFGADHQSSEHDPMIEEGASDFYLNRLALLGLNQVLAPGSLDSEKVRYALKTQLFYSFLDTACLCQFVWGPSWEMFGPQETVQMMQDVTGWSDFSLEELLKVGERRLNLMRAFNAREGLTRVQDQLPAKFFQPLQGEGPTAGVALDPEVIERAKEEYYTMLGWDPTTGQPTPQGLANLGLDWVNKS